MPKSVRPSKSSRVFPDFQVYFESLLVGLYQGAM